MPPLKRARVQKIEEVIELKDCTNQEPQGKRIQAIHHTNEKSTNGSSILKYTVIPSQLHAFIQLCEDEKPFKFISGPSQSGKDFIVQVWIDKLQAHHFGFHPLNVQKEIQLYLGESRDKPTVAKRTLALFQRIETLISSRGLSLFALKPVDKKLPLIVHFHDLDHECWKLFDVSSLLLMVMLTLKNKPHVKLAFISTLAPMQYLSTECWKKLQSLKYAISIQLPPEISQSDIQFLKWPTELPKRPFAVSAMIHEYNQQTRSAIVQSCIYPFSNILDCSSSTQLANSILKNATLYENGTISYIWTALRTGSILNGMDLNILIPQLMSHCHKSLPVQGSFSQFSSIPPNIVSSIRDFVISIWNSCTVLERHKANQPRSFMLGELGTFKYSWSMHRLFSELFKRVHYWSSQGQCSTLIGSKLKDETPIKYLKQTDMELKQWLSYSSTLERQILDKLDPFTEPFTFGRTAKDKLEWVECAYYSHIAYECQNRTSQYKILLDQGPEQIKQWFT